MVDEKLPESSTFCPFVRLRMVYSSCSRFPFLPPFLPLFLLRSWHLFVVVFVLFVLFGFRAVFLLCFDRLTLSVFVPNPPLPPTIQPMLRIVSAFVFEIGCLFPSPLSRSKLFNRSSPKPRVIVLGCFVFLVFYLHKSLFLIFK